jgi:hypothetical protein
MKKLIIAVSLLTLIACEKESYECKCFDNSKGYSVGSSGGGLTKEEAQSFCDNQKSNPANQFASNPDITCSVNAL